MLFGIIALLTVGASWCVIGVVFGRAPKDGLDTAAIQLGNALVTIVASVLIYSLTKHSAPPLNIILATCGTYVLAGMLNYYALQTMSRGMACGPNGIVWGIMQSALVFTFLGGIIFFGEKLTLSRGCGILLLASALVCFGLAGDNKSKSTSGTKWRAWAFLALLITAVQQNVANAPSFFSEAREVSSVLRALATASGTALASVTGLAHHIIKDRAYGRKLNVDIRRPLMWLYISMPLFFSLIFAYTLFYPGMDAMAKAGAGAVNYPLMVGSCIVSFTLYSRIFLHEKFNRLQLTALILCVSGLAGLCVPA